MERIKNAIDNFIIERLFALKEELYSMSFEEAESGLLKAKQETIAFLEQEALKRGLSLSFE